MTNNTMGLLKDMSAVFGRPQGSPQVSAKGLDVNVGHFRLIPSGFDTACNICGHKVKKYEDVLYNMVTGTVCLYCDHKAEDYYALRMNTEQKFNADRQKQETVFVPVVYTDGSFKNGQYAWAYEILLGEKILAAKAGLGSNQEAAGMRNIAGELSAVMRALKEVRSLGYTKVKLCYDYEGIGRWINSEWKIKSPFVQKFKDYVESLALEIECEQVKGHSGHAGNERVDKAAYAALG